ncbi:MAG: hypothetical protein AAFP02_11350, partial [Bacteroidota bacterium]
MLRKTFFFLTFSLLLASGLVAQVQTSHTIKVAVIVDQSVEEQFRAQGRLFLFFSEAEQGEPRRQTWPRLTNHIFAQNVDWPEGQTVYFDSESTLDSNGDLSLIDFPDGKYRVQVLWDQNQTASSINAPGNLYSEVLELELREDRRLELKLNQIIPERKSISHPLLREHNFRSDTLSKWWDKEMEVEFSVLLPRSFEEGNKRYPILYDIGGYGSRHYRAGRIIQRDSAFMAWWMSEAPEIIIVFLDGEGPYGDSYQLDS